MLGLFRDCGIPILLQAYPDYKDILREANQYPDDYHFSYSGGKVTWQ